MTTAYKLLNSYSQVTAQLLDKHGLLADVTWMAIIPLTGRHCQLSCADCSVSLSFNLLSAG